MTITAPNGPPDAVRDVNTHFYGGEHYIGQRLLTDSRMGQVWKTLMKEGCARELANPEEFNDRLDSLPVDYRMKNWGAAADELSLAEQACASFFLATSIIFAVGNHAINDRDVRKELKRYQEAAKLCREALYFPHRAANDPGLAAHLAASAAYFEEREKFISNANMNSPYIVERARGPRRYSSAGAACCHGNASVIRLFYVPNRGDRGGRR
jgi:hypothetical protein